MHRSLGTWPGGVHVELTGQSDITADVDAAQLTRAVSALVGATARSMVQGGTVVIDVRGATPAYVHDFDSSEPAATGVSYGVPLLGGVALFLAASFLLLLRRGQRKAVL